MVVKEFKPAAIRWGIVGTANIALRKVIPAMQRCSRGTVVAIASRDVDKAKAAARGLGISKFYGAYENLLADAEIDAVYIPLPNHLHVPWAFRALQAGKHVLCEKPIALNAREASLLLDESTRCKRQVLEAFMIRQHLQWERARRIVNEGQLGDVYLIQTTISYVNLAPQNVRNQVGCGGGALLDVGCYAIAMARMLFASEPTRAIALFDRDPVMKIDRLTSGLVDFERGRQLVFSSSTQLTRFQRVEVFGTIGRLEIPIAISASPDLSSEILTDMGGALDGSGVERIELPACDQYTLQADEAARVFLGEEPPRFPVEDAVANMKVIDALGRSEVSGRWEEVQV